MTGRQGGIGEEGGEGGGVKVQIGEAGSEKDTVEGVEGEGKKKQVTRPRGEEGGGE